MLRNYKPKLQLKKYGSCNKETFESALAMVTAGKCQRATCV